MNLIQIRELLADSEDFILLNDTIMRDPFILQGLDGGVGAGHVAGRIARNQMFSSHSLLNRVEVQNRHPMHNTNLNAAERIMTNYRPHLTMLVLGARQSIVNAPAGAPIALDWAERQKIADYLNNCTQAELNAARAHLTAFIALPQNLQALPNQNQNIIPNSTINVENCRYLQDRYALHQNMVAPDPLVQGRVLVIGPDPAVVLALVAPAGIVANEAEQARDEANLVLNHPDLVIPRQVTGVPDTVVTNHVLEARRQAVLARQRADDVQRLSNEANVASARGQGDVVTKLLAEAQAANNAAVQARNAARVARDAARNAVAAAVQNARPEVMATAIQQKIAVIKHEIETVRQYDVMCTNIAKHFNGRAIVVDQAIASAKLANDTAVQLNISRAALKTAEAVLPRMAQARADYALAAAPIGGGLPNAALMLQHAQAAYQCTVQVAQAVKSAVGAKQTALNIHSAAEITRLAGLRIDQAYQAESLKGTSFASVMMVTKQVRDAEYNKLAALATPKIGGLVGIQVVQDLALKAIPKRI